METLELVSALDAPELLAVPVGEALARLDVSLSTRIRVARIDPDLADTAAFSAAYGVGLETGANCLIVAGRRGEITNYAGCVVLATTKADVNGTVRRLLGAKRASFAPMDDAVALTGMEFGGITPLGLPADWRIFVDARVQLAPEVVIGAGIRAAKIVLPGAVLCQLPGVEAIESLARP